MFVPIVCVPLFAGKYKFLGQQMFVLIPVFHGGRPQKMFVLIPFVRRIAVNSPKSSKVGFEHF